MAILDGQSWQQFPSGSDQTDFDRHQNWSRVDQVDYFLTGGPFNDGHWAADRDGDYMRLDGQWGLTTIYCAFWFLLDHANFRNGRDIIRFYEGTAGSGTEHFGLALNYNTHDVSVNSGGSTLGYAPTFLPYNVDRWTHIAIKLVVHNTTGAFDVRFNGRSVLSDTNVDTRNGGTSGDIDYIEFPAEFQWFQRIAHPIVWSSTGDSPTDFFGMHRVHMIKPDGDTSTQFTAQGAGSNYVEVDEQGYDDDTTYNESSTSTNKDTLTTESLPTEVVTVYSVQAKAVATDPDATPTESIKVGLNSGTESLSSAQTLSGSYEIFEGPLETVDPNTSSQWTEANVNSTDVVYEHA